MSLITFIEDEEDRAVSTDVEDDREKALRYYQPNKPLGNEIDGRSQVVMRDTYDVVEGILPNLIKVFTSGEDVMSFTPNGPEDVKQAEQESDYVNYIVTQKNNGFLVFYDWIKDALLLKNGYVKVRVEEEERQKVEHYQQISEDQLALLMQDGKSEVVGSMQNPDGTMSVKIKRIYPYSCIKIDVLRPENVRVSETHREISLQDTIFVSHEEYKTLSELREMGFDVDDDINDDEKFSDVDETRSNDDRFDEGQDSEDPANRMVRVREVWCKYDENGDGIAEQLHVIVVGTTILLQEEADCVPIASFSCVRLPHRHDGISLADLLIEIQDTRTTLLRNALDAQYLANHGRHAIDMNRVNLDDMLVSRPGGIVRVTGDPGGAIMPLVNPVNGAAAVQMIEYMDTVRENRTGVTKYNQGIDSNTLNKTASGISQIMNASQQRIELMARLLAETGVKELYMLVHKYSLQYNRKEEVMKLRNDWVPVDPRTWSERKDMTISIGSATGDKQQQALMLEKLLQFMAQGLQMGLVSPQNMYHAASKYINANGFKDVDSFLSDPTKQPPKPPQDPPEIVKAKMEIQADQQKFQAETQMEQQKMAVEQQNKEKEALMTAELEKFKAELKAETEIRIAQIQTEARTQVEMVQAQNQAEIEHKRADNEANSSQMGHSVELRSILEQAKSSSEGNQAEIIMKGIEALIAAQNRPKKVVRDQSGRVSGVE